MNDYCAECGVNRIFGVSNYDEWGYEHYDDDPYYALLCPSHYEEWKKWIKTQRRNNRHYAFVIKQLEKVFPDAIAWLKNESYTEGENLNNECIDIELSHNITERMERILETYKEKTEKGCRILDKRIKEGIKEFLLDTCSICRHWDSGNVCNKLRCNIADLVIVRYNRGNFGICCESQEIQVRITGTGHRFDGNGNCLQHEIDKWKKDIAGLNKLV